MAKIVAALLLWSAAAAAAPLPTGLPAPPFTRADLNGRPVSLPAYRGRLVLLDFWASWCPPCLVEIPRLMALQKRYGGQLQIIGVSMDDNQAAARDIAARYRVNYPVTMGDAALGRVYGGILGLPEIYLIGRDGRVLQNWRGQFNPAEIDASVEAAVRSLPEAH